MCDRIHSRPGIPMDGGKEAIMNLYQSEGLPYPPIHVQQQNRRYAMEMLDNIGGRDSEMSAVSLYFYNHLVTDHKISDLFHRFSIMEMRHLEIFGRLAIQLGADPRLWSCTRGQPCYWSPAYNQYPTKLHPLLENAVDHERKAIAKYEGQACRIKDPNVVENLRRVIADEEEHLRVLTDLCNRAAL